MFLDMAASQPNKATPKLVNDSGEEGERPGWLEVGLRRVREQDAAEERRKKEEEDEAERERKLKMRAEYREYQRRQEMKHKEEEKQRHEDFKARWRKNDAIAKANRERENKIFRERVLREARLAREKEEEEECTSKRKDKGNVRSLTQ